MKLWTLCVSCFLLTSTEDNASAANGTPPQLINKTINITYSLSTPVRTPGGRAVNSSRNVEQWIYISTAGRIFLESHEGIKVVEAIVRTRGSRYDFKVVL
jgi:hypothetical protein